jgi:hypothetical protein
MQNSTHKLSLDAASRIHHYSKALIQDGVPVADLRNCEAYVVGVDAGKSISYWQALHDFWILYFKNAGASLRDYSVIREGAILSLFRR